MPNLFKYIVNGIRSFFANRKGPKPTAKPTASVKAILASPAPEKPIFIKPQPPKFEPIDVVAELPTHPTKTWQERTLDKVNKVIFHQSLSAGTVEGIARYHVTPGNHISESGCPGICYHYAIAMDPQATIYLCNYLTSMTWHCQGQNSSAIGVLVIGDYDGPNYKGQHHLTKDHTLSINKLMEYLVDLETIPNVDSFSKFFGHCDFGKPACPGYEIMEVISA